MTFLPIVARELRVASRRGGSYWTRAATAIVGIIAATIVYVLNSESAPQNLSQTLFVTLAVMAFIYCLFVGVRATADCLSEEKREGTLGLLFLTDLKGYDVVAGKLVATSLNAFYGLTAIFPLLAIPLLMGGITNAEFWRVALLLANTFLLSLGVGMLMSALCRSPRKAMAFTFLVLLFLSVGIPLILEWFPDFVRRFHLETPLSLMDPAYAGSWATDLRYSKSQSQFWEAVITVHCMFWLCLLLASLIVPRSWQDRPIGARSTRWRDRWHRWSYGSDAEKTAFRRRLLDTNSFYWLAGRARLKPLHVWIALTIVACLWTWGAVANGSSWTTVEVYAPTALVLNTMLKIWLTSEAGRKLGENRKLGSLELLLCTELEIKDILRGQLLALRRQFLGPVLAVLVVEAVFLVACLQSGSTGSDEVPMYLAWGLGFMAMLVVDLFALSAVAMWVSLTAKNPNRVTGISVRRVLVLPMAITIGFLLVGPIVVPSMAFSNMDWKIVFAPWLITGIVADLYFGLTAWNHLRRDFREVATLRFSITTSLLRRIFGRREKPAASAAPAATPMTEAS